MLSLTPSAAEVVDEIVAQEELPETAGLRITSENSGGMETTNGNGPQRGLRLSVVAEPELDDEQIDGAQIYVESGETAEMLDDKVLDAEFEGSEVRFTLTHQGGPEAA
jgi:iron-sulfur cluster assembly protein